MCNIWKQQRKNLEQPYLQFPFRKLEMNTVLHITIRSHTTIKITTGNWGCNGQYCTNSWHCYWQLVQYCTEPLKNFWNVIFTSNTCANIIVIWNHTDTLQFLTMEHMYMYFIYNMFKPWFFVLFLFLLFLFL